jgi:hypothetical protein
MESAMVPFLTFSAQRINKLRAINTLNSSTPAASTKHKRLKYKAERSSRCYTIRRLLVSEELHDERRAKARTFQDSESTPESNQAKKERRDSN